MKFSNKIWPYVPFYGIFKVFTFTEEEVGLNSELIQITSAIVQGFSISIVLQLIMGV